MISRQQAIALRARVLEALEEASSPEPVVPPAAVVWSPDDLPGDAPAAVRLRFVSAVPTTLEGEVQFHAVGGALSQVTRETFEVTLAILVLSRPSSSRPHHHQAASWLARRLYTYLAQPEPQRLLARVGLPILRRGPVVDRSAVVRGSQWRSAAELQLTCGLASIDRRAVDWIESAAGEGTLDDGAGNSTVIPWSAES